VDFKKKENWLPKVVIGAKLSGFQKFKESIISRKDLATLRGFSGLLGERGPFKGFDRIEQGFNKFS